MRNKVLQTFFCTVYFLFYGDGIGSSWPAYRYGSSQRRTLHNTIKRHSIGKAGDKVTGKSISGCCGIHCLHRKRRLINPLAAILQVSAFHS